MIAEIARKKKAVVHQPTQAGKRKKKGRHNVHKKA